VKRFTATLTATSGGGHYVIVPPATAEAAGLRYGVRVRGTINGAAYRSFLMSRAGALHMGVHKATIADAGVAPNAEIDVAIEIDDQPLPADTVPKDLARALAASPGAKAAWAALAPSHKREHVRHVTEAKQAATRERRIAATITALESQPAKRSGKPARSAPARRSSRRA
jgi:hypothetical protein